LQCSADPLTALGSFEASFTATDAWCDFVEMLASLLDEKAEWPTSMQRAVRWYTPTLEHRYDDAEARRADLAQLEAIAATFPSRERFLTELTLDPPGAVSDEAGVPGKDDDYLILSTIHSAKGQEWRVVHVLNVVDGCIPSDMATGSSDEIEEERRLLYVAMTRARDRLTLLVPQRFYVHKQAAMGDRHVYASRSRFVPDDVLRHFVQRAWPQAEVPSRALHVAEAGPRIDIAARLRNAWR
jgi:DNA helicase-2/ATP-dependent DNA helicase PcrA